MAAIGVVCVLTGCLLIPHTAARLTTGLLVLATGVVLVPGVTQWRVSWGCTVAALVAMAAVRAGTWVRQRWAVAVAAAGAVAVLVAFGSPIWAADTGNLWQPPFHWMRSEGSRGVADRVIAANRPGHLILAPDSLSITIAVTTTDEKVVAPRDYYMHYLRRAPSFHYRQRLTLVHFVNHDVPRWTQSKVSHALRVLPVDIACVDREDVRRYHTLRTAGFTPMLTTRHFRCLQNF